MEDTMPEYVGDISIRFPQRPEDVPNELEFNHSLMAQCEIDSLRSEILNLQDQRDLAMKVIKRLERERDELREVNTKLRDIAERAINYLDQSYRDGFSDEVSDLRYELAQIKEETK